MDPHGHAGRRDEVPIAHEHQVGVPTHSGVGAGRLGRQFPACGGTPAVQDPGVREYENTRAHRAHPARASGEPGHEAGEDRVGSGTLPVPAELHLVEGHDHDDVAAVRTRYSAHGESRMVRTKSPRWNPGT